MIWELGACTHAHHLCVAVRVESGRPVSRACGLQNRGRVAK